MVEEQKIEQKEVLKKLANGKLELTIENYGNKSGNTLIQVFDKSELKEEYKKLETKHHKNTDFISGFKNKKDQYKEEEIKELQELKEKIGKLREFDAFMQQRANYDYILDEQVHIRKGMKDIEREIPELLRNKK